MTDEEIISIMYDHASGFSSCIQFSDDAAVIAFARDLLWHAAAEPEPEPEPGSTYRKRLDECIQLIDQFMAQNYCEPRSTPEAEASVAPAHTEAPAHEQSPQRSYHPDA